MATNEKGSDLDVFEGLGKKAGSTAPPGGPPAPPPPPGAPEDANRSLLGMTSPGGMVAPPPPPGRTALPPVSPDDSASAEARPAVDVDWDDEDEATHIFDKDGDAPISRQYPAPTPAAGAPHPNAGLSMKSTLLGLTPPPYSSSRFTPPPPPPPGGPFARSASVPAPGALGNLPPPALGTLPPPPATLQGLGTTGQSRSIPPPPVGYAGPSPTASGSSTIPPGRTTMASDQAPRQNTELTAVLRPQQSRVALWMGLIVLAAAGAFFFLMPRTGRVLINVTDPRGSAVGRVDIFVDGRKQCDTAPCIVEQLSAGAHDIKILSDGYEAPPVQSVSIESRKDSVASFTLGAPSSGRGAGIKVSGTQPGVKLYLDDREVGPLPQDLRDMTPGEHIVKLVGSERYQPLERRVAVSKAGVEDLGTVTLKVLKGKATISLGTPGARVFLVSGSDRRELPMLPISVDIDTAKMWALQATRPGYSDYNQAISFDDGQAEKTYVVSLEPRMGPAVSQWASPPTNAAPVAQSERATSAPPMPAPQPQMQQQNAGGGGEGFLNINSIPPSTCFVDGRPLGPTPKVHVAVSAGTHQVKFVNAEQQLTGTVSVTVGAGQTAMAVKKLN